MSLRSQADRPQFIIVIRTVISPVRGRVGGTSPTLPLTGLITPLIGQPAAYVSHRPLAPSGGDAAAAGSPPWWARRGRAGGGGGPGCLGLAASPLVTQNPGHHPTTTLPVLQHFVLWLVVNTHQADKVSQRRYRKDYHSEEITKDRFIRGYHLLSGLEQLLLCYQYYR